MDEREGRGKKEKVMWLIQLSKGKWKEEKKGTWDRLTDCGMGQMTNRKLPPWVSKVTLATHLYELDTEQKS